MVEQVIMDMNSAEISLQNVCLQDIQMPCASMCIVRLVSKRV